LFPLFHQGYEQPTTVDCAPVSLQAEAELTLEQPNPHNLRTTKRRRSVGSWGLPIEAIS
jgi:hypothetical protein